MAKDVKQEAASVRAAVPGDLAAVMDIAGAWPAHFVDAGREMIAQDFAVYSAAVATAGSRVVGFLIWHGDGEQIELLWLAVAPDATRRGIGTALVEHALREARDAQRVYLLTATADSSIPGTSFDGAVFRGTNAFFGRLGFAEEKTLPRYWGDNNHALQMGRALQRSVKNDL